MDKLVSYLLAGLGSALGGMARVWLSNWAAHRWGDAFPWGTLLINTTGSFLIGFVAGLIVPGSRFGLEDRTVTFFTAGICGGFTTFSAFSLQTLRLAHQGHPWSAAANVGASVVCCLLAVALGHELGRLASR